jgi:hypothetical protein
MPVTNALELKAAIAELEQRKIYQERMLIEQFNHTYESLKPINIIKSTFNHVVHSPDLKTNLLDATIGLGAGIISKKLMVRGSSNFFRKMAGTLLEFAIAGIVTKNSGGIKKAGKGLLDNFFSGHKSRV